MSIIEKYNQRQAERRKHQLELTASDIYQVSEHDSELWLTFNGNLVCPCHMLNTEPVVAVKIMRELYIKRHSD